MSKWIARIEKCDNGYFVSYEDDETDRSLVVEMKEFPDDHLDIKSEQVAFMELANVLREYFNVNNDKHNNQYLDIKVSGHE